MKKKKRVRKIYIDLNFSAIKLITIFPSICSIFKKEKKITVANKLFQLEAPEATKFWLGK